MDRDRAGRSQCSETQAQNAGTTSPASVEERETFVYFAEADRKEGRLIKIGFSAYPMARMAQLDAEHGIKNIALLSYVSGNYHTEQSLHDLFSDLRVRGEWFRPTPRLVQFVEYCRQTGALPPEAEAVTRAYSALREAKKTYLDARRFAALSMRGWSPKVLDSDQIVPAYQHTAARVLRHHREQV